MGDRFSYTGPWHYQNVDICKPFDLNSACANGNCVSAQIDRQVKLIQDRTIPMREKIAALVFLIHFVGDLHMPLHSGDRSDRGGNDVRVAYGLYTSERLNLHSVWDGALAERALTTVPATRRRWRRSPRRHRSNDAIAMPIAQPSLPGRCRTGAAKPGPSAATPPMRSRKAATRAGRSRPGG